MTFSNLKIAFLQKREVIDAQKAVVEGMIKESIPSSTISFFSGIDEIEPGSQFDVVITPTLPWLDDALSLFSGVEWIHFLSAGVEKIWDMNFCKHSFMMSKSSGVHPNTISEYVLGAALYFEKRFNQFFSQSVRHEWSRIWLGELTGKRLMVLGAGAIGAKIAERAKVFGMETIGVVKTARKLEHFDESISLSEVEDELNNIDFLVCCLPLTPITKGYVDFHLLSLLKEGAVFIDVSRGGVVREEGVLKALEQGYLKGAALDVFEEQPLPEASLLWGREDVLITPHVSGTTQHYMQRAVSIFIQNHLSLINHGRLETPVDVEKGY